MKKRNSPAYQKLTEVLRNAVLQGELKPGERLKIDDLARRFKMSAMPVRQALQALENEGIVVTRMNRGAAVRVMDDELVTRLYDLREAVLGLIVRDCAVRIKAADLTALEKLARDQMVPDRARAREAQRMFFERIAAIGANIFAAEVLARHWPMLVAAREYYGLDSGAIVAWDQAALLAALARHDADDAARIAKADCIRAREELIAAAKARTRAARATPALALDPN